MLTRSLSYLGSGVALSTFAYALILSGVGVAVVVVGIMVIMLLPFHRARLKSRHPLGNPIPSMLHYRFPYTGYKVNLVIISS